MSLTIEALEARIAIEELIYRYARSIREDRPEDAAALFAQDGWFEIRDGHPDKPAHSVRARLEGRQGVHDYLVPGKGKPHPIPLIHNLIIELTGDTATAGSVMEAEVFGSGHKVIGEYHDRFRREGDEWRFASRTYTIYAAASSV